MSLLTDLETPALILDRTILDRNLSRMQARMDRHGVRLRPHVKTTKSIDVLRRVPAGPITVSTLKEAEYFLEHGITDILYAVGIAPGKLAHAAALVERGADLTLTLDNLEAARAARSFPVLIEIDVDGHRSGVAPDSELLIEVAKVLGSSLRGVMTHAGESYNCATTTEIVAMAERERAGAVRAAERLRSAGFVVPIVSVGSTPTATFAADLSGVTEVRAGVYMLHDLVMASLGVCSIDDIALSVLVSVIGHQTERGWIITDGGWMALSRDRGKGDHGYGLVRGVDADLIVTSANQEHGIVARRDGGSPDFSRYPIGSMLRILPNHACATGAQHSHYHIVSDSSPEILARWDRINGW
jgi:D-serine deaminase-like pyridoxal phosphate-dependent protein